MRVFAKGILAAVVLGLLGSCNIFNPSGESGSDASGEGLVAEGEAAMRSQEYEKAYDLFSRALAKDSGLSLAWHGLAKASVARDSLPVTEFIKKIDSLYNAPDSTKLKVITGMSDSAKNRYYKPLYRLMVIYKEFRRRDSLGVTDGALAASLVDVDLQAATLLGGVLFRTLDLDFDTLFTDVDNPLQGLFDNIQDGLKPSDIDAADFLASDSTGTADTSGTIDSTKISGLNSVLESASENLSTLVSLLGSATDSTTTGASSETEESIQDLVLQAGQSVTFYKFNNQTDDDGDGCVDEEVPDYVDNDGDGYVDEDGRMGYRPSGTVIAAGNKAETSPEDSVINDRLDGSTAGVLSGVDDVASGVLVYATDGGLLTPYASLEWKDLTQDSLYPIVKAKMESDAAANGTVATPSQILAEVRVELRLQVKAITDPAARIAFGQRRIGGCWNNVH